MNDVRCIQIIAAYGDKVKAFERVQHSIEIIAMDQIMHGAFRDIEHSGIVFAGKIDKSTHVEIPDFG